MQNIGSDFMSNNDEYFESLMITNEDIPGVEEAVEGIIGDKIFSGLMKLSIKHGHPDNLSGEKLKKWNSDKRILLNSLKTPMKPSAPKFFKR